MPVVCLGGMEGRFRLGKTEDQPSVTGGNFDGDLGSLAAFAILQLLTISTPRRAALSQSSFGRAKKPRFLASC